jgi:hypothetical protein
MSRRHPTRHENGRLRVTDLELSLGPAFLMPRTMTPFVVATTPNMFPKDTTSLYAQFSLRHESK